MLRGVCEFLNFPIRGSQHFASLLAGRLASPFRSLNKLCGQPGSPKETKTDNDKQTERGEESRGQRETYHIQCYSLVSKADLFRSWILASIEATQSLIFEAVILKLSH